MTSADTVQCHTSLRTAQQHPMRMLSTTSAAHSAFHQLPSMTARSVSGVIEQWADDRTTAEDYILPCST